MKYFSSTIFLDSLFKLPSDENSQSRSWPYVWRETSPWWESPKQTLSLHVQRCFDGDDEAGGGRAPRDKAIFCKSLKRSIERRQWQPLLLGKECHLCPVGRRISCPIIFGHFLAEASDLVRVQSGKKIPLKFNDEIESQTFALVKQNAWWSGKPLYILLYFV